ncbi:DUF4347 domain-containing protein, partial [Romeria aff. gracilis LEGE 07310]
MQIATPEKIFCQKPVQVYALTQINTPSQLEISTLTNNAVHLVFIDSGIEEYSVLLEGLLPEYRGFLLDPDKDGIEQISYLLAKFKDVQSLHIVSHGSSGCLKLGSSSLSASNFDQYSATLERWSESFADGGQMLLYGCRVAAGQAGAEFIQCLYERVGVAIAASSTSIGFFAKGRNWDLDTRTSDFIPRLALKRLTFQSYKHVLMDEIAPIIENVAALALLSTGADTYTFTVTYYDETGLDLTSFDSSDITVIAPDGTVLPVTLVSTDSNADGTSSTVTYSIATPGSMWGWDDNGTYSIVVNAGEISDTSGNTVSSGEIGTFSVSIPVGTIRIEAEDYLAGTNGVEYFDKSAGNNGNAYRTDDVDIEVTGDV